MRIKGGKGMEGFNQKMATAQQTNVVGIDG